MVHSDRPHAIVVFKLQVTLWSIRMLTWTPVWCPCKNLSLLQKTSGKKDTTQQKTVIQASSSGLAHSIKNITACTAQAAVNSEAEGMVGLPLSKAAEISARSERLHDDGLQSSRFQWLLKSSSEHMYSFHVFWEANCMQKNLLFLCNQY